ncbi:hypothetical protein [Botrimarina sp.]|uniref:hypothetical protein n=1 Tax=Botrimarina sp. TaxID=2795802 RepID=UPI0032EC736B
MNDTLALTSLKLDAATAPTALTLAPPAGSPAPPLPLGSTPLTIGAGPRCVLKVAGPGVAPIACVVTPIAAGASVRYWGGECRVNGEPFDEATLSAGDTLRVGPIEYSVVAGDVEEPLQTIPASGVRNEPADPPPVPGAPVGDSPERPAAVAGQRLASDRARVRRLAAAVREERRRAAATSQQLTESEVTIARLESQLASAAESRSVEPEQTSNGLTARLNQAEEQLAVAADAIEAAHDRIALLEGLLEEARGGAAPAAAPPTEQAAADSEAAPAAAARPAPPQEADAWPTEPGKELSAWPADAEAAILPVDTPEAAPAAASEAASAAPAIEETTAEESAPEESAPEESAGGRADDRQTADDGSDDATWGIEALAASASPAEAAALWGFTESCSDDDVTEPESATAPDEVALADAQAAPAEEAAEGPEAAIGESPTIGPEEPAAAEPEDDPVAALNPENSPVAALAEVPVEEPPAAPADEPAPAQPEEEPPVAEAAPPQSFIERYRHLIPDDEPQPTPAQPTPAQPASAQPALAPPPALAAPSEPAPVADAGEESIDEYMRKMMERIRGRALASDPQPVATPQTGPAPPKPAAAQSVEPIESTPTQPLPAPAAGEASIGAAPEEGDPSSEWPLPQPKIKPAKPRTPPADIGAMRQLANQSARQAIDVANVRQTRERATWRFGVAAFVFVCGAALAVTSTISTGAQFILGVAGLSGGGWYFMHTLHQTESAAAQRKRAAKPPASDD